LQQTVIEIVCSLQQRIINPLLLKITVFGRQCLRFGVDLAAGILRRQPSAMVAVFLRLFSRIISLSSGSKANSRTSLFISKYELEFTFDLAMVAVCPCAQCQIKPYGTV
jgi:hypothetical protein